jgi:hypothetical protein
MTKQNTIHHYGRVMIFCALKSMTSGLGSENSIEHVSYCLSIVDNLFIPAGKTINHAYYLEV